MLESVDLDSSQVTTYTWDDAGRLITTTVGGDVSRVYTYSQDGDLIQAAVEGTTTTFVYDGNGNRLQMSVEGTVTTYTLDYAGGLRVLFEEGGAFSDTKHYLYGLACLGEHVDADEPAEEEWRYYQRDAIPSAGSGLVRQTSDADREVTMAWTYSPTGGVVLGVGGPVTNLDCGAGGIYDWSTGLIFRNGRYFDPSTGIWITMGAIVTWQIRPKENRRQRRWRKRYGQQAGFLLFLLLLILMATTLSGCACTAVPTPGTPTVPPTLPPIGTPTPGQPGSPTPGQPSPTPGQPSPIPTDPPIVVTPAPPTPTEPPMPTSQIINIFPEDTIDSNPCSTDDPPQTGTIIVNYRTDYDHIGPVDNPIFKSSAPLGNVYIHYQAPIMNFYNAPIVEGSGGGRYYSKEVWNGLNELDLYARLVSAERASMIGDNPFDRERVLEGIGITYVIRNRTEDAYFGQRGGYREQILSTGQFAFTLTHGEGGDSLFVANLWANVANDPQERMIYEHSLRYVVGVDKDWLHDPTHGALYFRGSGLSSSSWFSSDESEWDVPTWP